MYRRRRAALPQGPTYSTYWVHVPASGVGYVPRTVAPQVLRRSKSAPDLLIIGVQLLDETKPHMEQLAAATENSKFIDASGGIDSLNDAFEEVAELIAE